MAELRSKKRSELQHSSDDTKVSHKKRKRKQQQPDLIKNDKSKPKILSDTELLDMNFPNDVNSVSDDGSNDSDDNEGSKFYSDLVSLVRTSSSAEVCDVVGDTAVTPIPSDEDVSSENEVADNNVSCKLEETVEEGEGHDDEDEDNPNVKEKDLYYQHFQRDLPDELVSCLGKEENWSRKEIELPHLGGCVEVHCQRFNVGCLNLDKASPAAEELLKEQLKEKLWEKSILVNRACLKLSRKRKQYFTPFQRDLINCIFQYRDVLYPYRSYKQEDELRIVYCLHVLNHALKLRSLVRHHNAKIARDSEKEFRDQSLVRPKVLILLPFRSCALKVVNILLQLLPDRQFVVSGKKRFQEEFGQEDEIVRKSQRPADYEHLFAGNTDDCFKFGISLTKKAFKLYSDFYSSDIIVASPLGLRTVVGVDGDKERDYDFLHSLELVVMDQADVQQLQNWEHVQVILGHLHSQPRDAHGVDFSRCRLWNLNGWGKHYRQTLVFSDILTPEILSLFNKHCRNFAGKLMIQSVIDVGAISHVLTPVPHTFQRLQCASHQEVEQARFTYFTTNVLPQYLESSRKHVLVFIPSYFDYVKIRNYLKRKEVRFSAISETVSEGNVSRARNSFYKGDRSLLLYTERYHFFRRTSFKRVSHVVFYQLPHYATYYSELCNMLPAQSGWQNNTCVAIYSRYDALRLAYCVGTQRASEMISGKKMVHQFITGELTTN